MDKKETLETAIRMKSDWSTKAFDELFGGLEPQDFVNIYELGEIYLDELGMDEADEVFVRLAALTGLKQDDLIKLSDTYSTSLLGLYDTIGRLVSEDRERQEMSPDEKFAMDQKEQAYLEAQEAIRERIKELGIEPSEFLKYPKKNRRES